MVKAIMLFILVILAIGIDNRLDDLLREQRTTNSLLETISARHM